MKLDPRRPTTRSCGVIPAREIGFEGAGGSWSTPALYGDVVYFTTAAGRVLQVDRVTGDVVQELAVGAPAIASPVVVDGVLIQGDCTGDLYAWDVSDRSSRRPHCGSCTSTDAWNRRRRSGAVGCTSGPGRGTSTASPTHRHPAKAPAREPAAESSPSSLGVQPSCSSDGSDRSSSSRSPRSRR